MTRVFGADANERKGAILILDQAGFTRILFEDGVERALDLVWRMRRVSIPVLRSFGGEVYKVDADNIYVYFHTVDEAVEAAAAAHRALRDEEHPIEASVGIGFGTFLHLPSEDDYFGGEVNLASKLGEDLAGPRETLLTEAAFAALSDSRSEGADEQSISISGMQFRCFRMRL